MLNVQLLSARYKLSPKQVRDRLTSLSPAIAPYIITGKQNAKLLTDEGLAIFDRLIQLEREGIAMTTAVELISKDGLHRQSETVNRPGGDGLAVEYIAELRERIASLERDKSYLQERLAQVLEQLEELQQRALPSAGSRRGGSRGPGLRQDGKLRADEALADLAEQDRGEAARCGQHRPRCSDLRPAYQRQAVQLETSLREDWGLVHTGNVIPLCCIIK